MVDDILYCAVTGEGAICWFSTVTSVWCFAACIEDLAVVGFYYFLDIGHARVAYLYVVSITNLSQWVGWWEMLFDERYEVLTNVCGDVSAEWRVEPCDLALFALAFGGLVVCGPGVVSQAHIVSGFF